MDLFSQFCESRGYDASFFDDLEKQPTALLKDIDLLCLRLADIRASGELIVVLPDFDMDGIASGVIGYAGLSELGFNCALYCPDSADGHAFGPCVVDKLVRSFPAVKHIISCDCGISEREAVERATSLGIEFLVTDHHPEMSLAASRASVIVDPNRFDTKYENSQICGANVLWKALMRFSELYCDVFMTESIRRLGVFAGIGTVSDMMELRGENRPLVRGSVDTIRTVASFAYLRDFMQFLGLAHTKAYLQAFEGLFNLIADLKERGKIIDVSSINCRLFAFYIAPLFNSLKRFSLTCELAFDVFFSGVVKSRLTVAKLVELSERRKEVSEMAFHDVMSDPALELYPHMAYMSPVAPGMLGLIASEVVALYGCPCVVVNQNVDGTFSGSGRSTLGFDARQALSDLGAYAEGHSGAFGVSFESSAQLKDVMSRFNSIWHTYYTAHKDDALKEYDVHICSFDTDTERRFDVHDFRALAFELSRLEPFGIGFPEAKIRLDMKATDYKLSYIGHDKQHTKLSLPDFSVLSWNTRASDTSRGYTCIGSPLISTYNDHVQVSLAGDLIARK